jgi:prolyl oligopeptidase
MSGVLRLILLSLCLVLVAVYVIANDGASAPTAGPPSTKTVPVEETLHGQKIVDPYRWLENADSPETQEYVRQQLAYTRSRLDPLPGRESIHTRVSELLTVGTLGTPQVGGDYYFYTRREGNQNQPVLYVRKGEKGEDRVLVDVNKLAADGTVALDWWYPTRDGKYLVYGTSPSGSEISTLHIVETASGDSLPDTIERTRAASIAWKPDNSGFYYTRYPKPGEVPAGEEMYNRHVFYHQVGSDAAKDPLIFGEGRDPQEWPSVELSDDGRYLLVTAGQGWTKTELFLQDLQKEGSKLERITDGKNFLYYGEMYKGDLYILANEDAPRYRMLKASLAKPERAAWKQIVPEAKAVLANADIVAGQIVAHYQQDATSRMRLYSADGKAAGEVKLPTLGNIEDLSRDYHLGGDHDGKEAFFVFQSFTIPMTAYRYDFQSKQVSQWATVKAPVDPAPYEVKQVFYKSKDGTQVPMFIVHRKGLKLDGTNPTLLTGYGGFNVTNSPVFLKSSYIWLEHGGIYALANLRGGAEYGEDWHRAGMLANKQNVFDDFIAAAEYLIAQKYTSSDRLAIQGGSNGGLLVGAAMTQRPELFRAVICQVPLLDMLRYQNFQIAKLWIPEYGSAENAEQFKWLYAYSPYHHVKEGTLYPATLIMTADSDTRVDPMHSKKMAARLQSLAKNGPDRPILLRIEPKAGHGAGKPISKLVEEGTDIWSFLFWQMGIKP